MEHETIGKMAFHHEVLARSLCDVTNQDPGASALRELARIVMKDLREITDPQVGEAYKAVVGYDPIAEEGEDPAEVRERYPEMILLYATAGEYDSLVETIVKEVREEKENHENKSTNSEDSA